MNCDKCNTKVPSKNDATFISLYAGEIDAFQMFFIQSRHFLPVIDADGKVICEGSPSRAQYIEGQPKDSRGYPYILVYEQIWRDAYQKVQEEIFDDD